MKKKPTKKATRKPVKKAKKLIPKRTTEKNATVSVTGVEAFDNVPKKRGRPKKSVDPMEIFAPVKDTVNFENGIAVVEEGSEMDKFLSGNAMNAAPNRTSEDFVSKNPDSSTQEYFDAREGSSVADGGRKSISLEIEYVDPKDHSKGIRSVEKPEGEGRFAFESYPADKDDSLKDAAEFWKGMEELKEESDRKLKEMMDEREKERSDRLEEIEKECPKNEDGFPKEAEVSPEVREKWNRLLRNILGTDENGEIGAGVSAELKRREMADHELVKQAGQEFSLTDEQMVGRSGSADAATRAQEALYASLGRKLMQVCDAAQITPEQAFDVLKGQVTEDKGRKQGDKTIQDIRKKKLGF